ncbi:YqiA/YcfP family alpha/beta fold hydrolase [Halomonas sp. M20]|uniref:YqiA/YcfP family alpha/beta fold hydrolase n=1 Tax=Halomonas sp. M20 TaxID=2763264 RepID=UPI001D09A987|nr:YqiA/YcfP family alpha/beta fold hydrolase [Halomonas sp. M20]
MLNGQETRPPVDAVLYLHGFNSGSESPKAQLMRAACKRIVHQGKALPCSTPQLPQRPQAAFEAAQAALEALGSNTLVVGSSMGGFLASCLAERFDLAAVLLNPAVRPAHLIDELLGTEFVNDYTGERFTVDAAHGEELARLVPPRLDPGRYLLLLGTADETLDCRDAFKAYTGCRTLIEPGGDHGFSRIEKHLPAILAQGGHCLTPYS